MAFHGTIIEESLTGSEVLALTRIRSTRKEPVRRRHATPWLREWTLHSVDIPEAQAEVIAQLISRMIDPAHANSWYADFHDEHTHYVIFRNRVFRVDRNRPEAYRAAIAYGESIGVPKHQLVFHRRQTASLAGGLSKRMAIAYGVIGFVVFTVLALSLPFAHSETALPLTVLRSIRSQALADLDQPLLRWLSVRSVVRADGADRFHVDARTFFGIRIARVRYDRCLFDAAANSTVFSCGSGFIEYGFF